MDWRIKGIKAKPCGVKKVSPETFREIFEAILSLSSGYPFLHVYSKELANSMANNAPSPECEESPPPPKRSRYCELGVFFNKVIAEMPVYLRTPPGADSEYSMKRVLGADSPTDRRLVLVGK